MSDAFFGPMDESQYRQLQRAGALGGSALSTIYSQSVAHYLAGRGGAPSAAMRFGTAAHTLLLEPELWAERYCRQVEVVRAELPEITRDGKAWICNGASYSTKKDAEAANGHDHPWQVGDERFASKREAVEASKAMSGGREPIDDATHAQLLELVGAVHAHPIAGALLAPDSAHHTIICEAAMLWTDTASGVDCSGKIDALIQMTSDLHIDGIELHEGEWIGVDLKTTGTRIASGLDRRCLDAGWHLQAAHYMAGATAASMPIDRWINVVVETSAPYGVQVVEIGQRYLELGEYARQTALRRWREYQRGKRGPAYPAELVTIEPPRWAIPAALAAEWAEREEQARASIASERETIQGELAVLRRRMSEAAETAAQEASAGRAAHAWKAIDDLDRMRERWRECELQLAELRKREAAL